MNQRSLIISLLVHLPTFRVNDPPFASGNYTHCSRARTFSAPKPLRTLSRVVLSINLITMRSNVENWPLESPARIRSETIKLLINQTSPRNHRPGYGLSAVMCVFLAFSGNRNGVRTSVCTAWLLFKKQGHLFTLFLLLSLLSMHDLKIDLIIHEQTYQPRLLTAQC